MTMPCATAPSPAALSINEHHVSLLHRCTTLRHMKQLQAFLLSLGHGRTQFYALKLMRFSALVLADIPYARLIFESLPAPNVFLYSALISAYASRPDPDSPAALRLFAAMLRGVPAPRPNEFIYPSLLKSCSDPRLARSLHSLLSKSGFHDFAVVRTALLDSYSRFSDTHAARYLFDEMPQKNVVSWTALLTGYMRTGQMGKALFMFEEMPDRDVPAWNAVISGCTQNGLFLEALSFFSRMVVDGALPNMTTVSCLFSACAHLGMLRLGKSLHGYVFKNSMGNSPFVCNALIDMYGKCGNVKKARWIFSTMSEKNITSWNSMINCMALQGHSCLAIETFREMEQEGPQPDQVTFMGLLNACTHAGLVDEGLGYFNSMTRDYTIDPEIEHYGCVIDLLSRAGRFDVAMDIVRDMRIEPDEVVWGSLLNGARVHGAKDLAELALRKLLELEPKSVDYGFMLANLYSECGKWEDVGKVRKRLNQLGGKKLPGCSWIEVEKSIHQFYSGDTIHPEVGQIYKILDELVDFMEA
ncbi:pentatricopeptide repeat-containing protein At1g33350-like [Zingiber officinale]|nr:pentatricopeptide repeat-containing protein At1g33350-like [Zingiber officinale]XP_042456993.1 pentatricopeptide repeat-containing protein At1g33350-like [Zingiber officinale]